MFDGERAAPSLIQDVVFEMQRSPKGSCFCLAGSASDATLASLRLHADLLFLSTELMSAATFQRAVQEGTQHAIAADWGLEWVLRYSIIVKSRGIIKAKGYLVSARKASP